MKESQKISLKKIYEDYEPDALNDTEEMYVLKNNKYVPLFKAL